MTNIDSAGHSDDLLIIAAYSSDNQLISFDFFSAYFPPRTSQKFSTLITVPDGKKLGHVKAYVWNDIHSMDAVSNALFQEFNPLEGLQKVQYSVSQLDDSPMGYQFGEAGENDFIRFYESPSALRPTKYILCSGGAQLNVNGVAVGTLDQNLFKTYLSDNPCGDVELVDTYTDIAPADGFYDIVNVTYCVIAQVDFVSARTGQVFFKRWSANCSDRMTLGEDVTYTITCDGESLAPADLREDDILTIAYDLTKAFSRSPFYIITVSRKTAEGMFAGTDRNERTITLGESQYEFAELSGETYTSLEVRFLDTIGNFGLTLTREYKAYLDVNGRIFHIEQIAVAKNIAIVEDVVVSGEYENYGLTLFHSDGTVDTKNVRPGTRGWEDPEAAANNVYSDIDNKKKIGISGRVIEYMQDSKGNITSMYRLAENMYSSRFKAAIQTIGRLRMGSDTVIVDAFDYNTLGHHIEDLKIKTIDELVNNAEYRVYSFGAKADGSICPFVILAESYPIEEFPPSTDNTRLAVLTSSANVRVIDGEVMDVIPLLIEGEAKTLAISNDAVLSWGSASLEPASLQKGDMVTYTLNGQGHIQTLDVIFKADGFAASSGYADLVQAMRKTGDHSELLRLPNSDTLSWTKEWDPYSPTDTQIVIGPIVERGKNFFSIGKTAIGTVGDYTGSYTDLSRDEKDKDPYGKENEGGVLPIVFNADTTVYVYDYAAPSRASLTVGSTDDLLKSYFTLLNKSVIPWNWYDSNMNVAVAKVVNGAAQDVLVFIGNN